MKPNTKLFAFFDNTLVSDYVTPIKTLNITNVPPATAQYIKNNKNIFADQYGELKLRGQSTAHEVFVADIDYLDATSLKLYVLENVPGKKNTSFSLGEVLFLVERDGKSHNMGSFPNEGIVGGKSAYPLTSAPSDDNHMDSQLPLKPVCPVKNTRLPCQNSFSIIDYQIFHGALPSSQSFCRYTWSLSVSIGCQKPS